MNGKTYAYLDLTAMSAVGAALLDPRPAWVFSGDGKRILWANVGGAEFFGAENIGTLLEHRLGSGNPAVKQIARLSRLLPSETSRLEILRFASGFGLSALACACRRINLPGSESAVLVISTTGADGAQPLTAQAERLTDAIAGEDCLVAVIGADGGIIAASGGFQNLAPASSSIDTLADAVTHGEDRLIKRPIEIGTQARPAGAARFERGDERFALMIVGPADRPIETVSPTGKAPTPASASGQVVPAASTSLGPLLAHFLWRSDAEDRIAFVSDDLADAVGAASAEISGRRWREIARWLFPEAEAALSAALESRATWDGITVYWPVEGRNQPIPVTLAAFPVSDDGGFDGYRGTGVLHVEDAGQAHAADEAKPMQSEADPNIAPTPDAKEITTPEQTPPSDKDLGGRWSNIVRLPGTGATPAATPERLTGIERDAFRRIAEALGAQVTQELKQIAVEPAKPDREPLSSDGLPAQVVPTPDRKLLDRLPIGILVFRGATTLFANRTLLDLLGYDSEAEFAAAGGGDTLFPDGAPNWERPDLGGSNGQLTARRKDGGQLAVEARLQAVTWADATALMVTLRERPPRREMETAPDHLIEEIAGIEARVEELEAILDTATDGVIVIDASGRIGNLNRSAEALFGIEANEVLGTPFTDLLAEESRKAALDYLDGLASNGVASVLNDGREVIGKVPQGGLIPLFMTMGRLGDTSKYCAVLRDITQWKNAEEELVAARRAAEAANAQKSDFLAKISHEIRTPLNAIIGFSEVMMEERFGPIDNQRYRDYLRDIHVSGSHLMSLINDLLDLSKIEAGKLDLSFEAVGLNETIQECVALMQPQANRERIIIRTSLSSGVPNVVADPRSLRQILLNLLSNAVKFTQAGGQVIVSTAVEHTGEVVIRIRDTGVGMSEKDIETALKPFRQLATASRPRGEGTGLGLPLTKALVEANRAAFSIDSAINQGTMVKITFPTTRVLAG